ncbi:MAG: hypothetical protein JO352_03445 [Chloroflexi bacterium]|nr:hypothetical protein [Chloroflexota bacterium]MBV9597943.1 hypothetical protein [Chloroflexota bacterium]
MSADLDEGRQTESVVPGVREVAPNIYSIRSEPEPRGPGSRFLPKLRRLALGAPLPTRLERTERLGILMAMGSRSQSGSRSSSC